jgi:hypothetical protein
VPREVTPDFVAEVVAMVAEETPLEPDRCAALARLIRDRQGGRRVWIGSKGPAVDPDQVEARLRAGKSVARIAGEIGVGRSTIYACSSSLARRRRRSTRRRPRLCQWILRRQGGTASPASPF